MNQTNPVLMDWQPEPLQSHTQPSQTQPSHPTISPKPNQPHTHTVIFLHGRGDTATNFMRGLWHYRTWTDSSRRTPMDIFPTFRWVFPTAGMKPCANPAGARAMSQWFDVWGGPDNLAEREEVQLPGLRESVRRIRELIDEEARRLGGRYDKIVVMGISQGGATGLSTLLSLDSLGLEKKASPESGEGQKPQRLGAYVGIACRMLFPGRTLDEWRALLGVQESGEKFKGEGAVKGNEILKNTPVFFEHTIDDPTVRITNGRQLKETLTSYGADQMEWKEYVTGGHWFHSPRGLDDLAAFLTRVLPQS